MILSMYLPVIYSKATLSAFPGPFLVQVDSEGTGTGIFLIRSRHMS